MLRSKVSWKKASSPRKKLLLALVRDLNEIALTLLEKHLDAIVNGSEEET